jgi:protein regulator of cytokinesis 1
VYSDALLSAHEAEIARLETLKEQRAPILQVIDKHRSLIKDREDLAASSQDASRLMMKGQKGEKRDPTRLLREEKMRKRIAKELPKVEAELRKTLERWEDEYGRPFLVHGERYLDELAALAAKAPPPRSKTPSGLSGTNRVQKPTPAPASRPGSVMRGPAPSHSGAKTPTAGSTLRKKPLSASVSAAGGWTPSKIPARAPLGNMPHGNNSPERRNRPESRQDVGMMGKIAPPPRAPPPKMREYFVPPPAPTPMQEHRSISVASSGSVRQVPPEDVYDDRVQGSHNQPSMEDHVAEQPYHGMHSSTAAPYFQQEAVYRVSSGSRQISSTSAATTAASGSENWETYDDASEPEVDASEAYYSKLRAARGKRYTPDSGYGPPHGGQGKKLKGMLGGSIREEILVEENGHLVSIRGSDTAWTDEEAF